MAMTDAEKQARYRARRREYVRELEERVLELEDKLSVERMEFKSLPPPARKVSRSNRECR